MTKAMIKTCVDGGRTQGLRKGGRSERVVRDVLRAAIAELARTG